jgi:hypothetical protein
MIHRIVGELTSLGENTTGDEGGAHFLGRLASAGGPLAGTTRGGTTLQFINGDEGIATTLR